MCIHSLSLKERHPRGPVHRFRSIVAHTQHPSVPDPRSRGPSLARGGPRPRRLIGPRDLSRACKREQCVVRRTEIPREEEGRVPRIGVFPPSRWRRESGRRGESPQPERDSGSSDAHRTRTAFQLAASRCRDKVVFIVGFNLSVCSYRF